MGRDACLQSLFNLSTRVPSKGALPPGSLYREREREREMRPTSRAPINHLLKSLVEEPTPGYQSPMKGIAHPHSLPFITFRAPQQRSPTPRFPVTDLT
jgi:hypothetical protein